MTLIPEAAEGVDAAAVVLTRLTVTLVHVIAARPTDVSRHATAPETVRSRRTSAAITTRTRRTVIDQLTRRSYTPTHIDNPHSHEKICSIELGSE